MANKEESYVEGRDGYRNGATGCSDGRVLLPGSLAPWLPGSGRVLEDETITGAVRNYP